MGEYVIQLGVRCQKEKLRDDWIPKELICNVIRCAASKIEAMPRADNQGVNSESVQARGTKNPGALLKRYRQNRLQPAPLFFWRG